MTLVAISITGGKGNGGQGRNSRNIVKVTPFPSHGNALFDVGRALQKGHFCSLAEMGSGQNFGRFWGEGSATHSNSSYGTFFLSFSILLLICKLILIFACNARVVPLGLFHPST